MQKLIRWGAYAGVIAALLDIAGIYQYATAVDWFIDDPTLGAYLYSAYGLAHVLYWFGLALLATKYKNQLLHVTAVAFIAISVVTDFSFVLGYIYPASAAWDAWASIGYLTSVVVSIGMIIAGVAVWQLREESGPAATWYAALAILSGSFLLLGYSGQFMLDLFLMLLNPVLYLLGSVLLFRSGR